MTRPLVLLHGFTGSPESWAPVADLLPPPVVAPAALGHDGTPGPPGVDTFEDELDRLDSAIVERLSALRGTRGDPRADPPADPSTHTTASRPAPHLAGYSMGGRLALGLLVRHPERFASATLIGASPGLADPGERYARGAGDEAWARLLETEGLDTFVARWEALPIFATQDALPDDVAARQRAVRRAHDPRGLARSLRVAGLARMPDYRPRLADIRIPVRLVVGERDGKFRALAAEMAARLPQATVTLVPGAGHNVLLERPREIAALLREDRG